MLVMLLQKIRLTETLLFLIFFLSIFIDSLNGYMQISLGIYTPIGILYRGILSLLLLGYVNVHAPSIGFKQLYIIAFSIYVVMLPFWDIFSGVSGIGQNIVFLLKFLYGFVLYCFFLSLKNRVKSVHLVNILINTSVLICCLNIVCLLLGIGNYTYKGEQFGYKAFYVDGNSLGIYLVMNLGLSIWHSLVSKRWWSWAKTIVITLGTLIVASRAAIGGTFLIWGCIVFYITFVKEKYIVISKFRRLLLGGVIIGGLVGLLVVIVGVLENSGALMLERFTIEAASSPRGKLLFAWNDVVEKYDCIEWLLGVGPTVGRESLGVILVGS